MEQKPIWIFLGKNHIFLVDFENVHTAGLKGQNYLKDAVIHVFFSSNTCNQPQITLDLHELYELQRQHVTLKFHETIKGHNALDFQLTSYLGLLIDRASSTEQTNFYIVSKDKGYTCLNDFWQQEQEIEHHKFSIKFISSIMEVSNPHLALPYNSATPATKSEQVLPTPAVIKTASVEPKVNPVLPQVAPIVAKVAKIAPTVTTQTSAIPKTTNSVAQTAPVIKTKATQPKVKTEECGANLTSIISIIRSKYPKVISKIDQIKELIIQFSKNQDNARLNKLNLDLHKLLPNDPYGKVYNEIYFDIKELYATNPSPTAPSKPENTSQEIEKIISDKLSRIVSSFPEAKSIKKDIKLWLYEFRDKKNLTELHLLIQKAFPAKEFDNLYTKLYKEIKAQL
ncbi:MAG: PIN domain-containing protein [Succinivibrionaceae bacterium]|nr:PIN domain-containing protein [Succinivibrionaceae bacterium]